MASKVTLEKNSSYSTLPKAPTGIEGLDEITQGGFPRGRPTLICGSAGCGKTLLAMEFLIRGATEYGEPGVFMAFEESAEEISPGVGILRTRKTSVSAAVAAMPQTTHKTRVPRSIHLPPATIADPSNNASAG